MQDIQDYGGAEPQALINVRAYRGCLLGYSQKWHSERHLTQEGPLASPEGLRRILRLTDIYAGIRRQQVSRARHRHCPISAGSRRGAKGKTARLGVNVYIGTCERNTGLERRRRYSATLLLHLVAILACTASHVNAQSCAQVDSVGLSESYYNNYADISEGHAAGQTFLATDTEIDAITVWRAAIWATQGFPWHIYIMGLDSLGTPDPTKMIQDGPTLVHTDGDGSQSTPFRFVFNPPVTLPGPGEYEFAVMLDQCIPGPSSTNINYGDGSNYPQGIYWDHGRQVFSCSDQPRAHPMAYPASDLIFTIEFCRSTSPTRPSTWGQVKALYR